MKFKHRRKIITGCICMIFLLLLWGTTYYSVYQKDMKKPRNISVVLYHAGTNGWASLLEGMKQAENDYSVNLSYIQMKEGMDFEDQRMLMQKEIDNGAEALIIANHGSRNIDPMTEELTANIPVVTVESGWDGWEDAHYSADNYAMGKKLGEVIANRYQDKQQINVVIVEDENERASVIERKKGFIDAVGEKATYRVLGHFQMVKNADVYVAFHKKTLYTLIDQMRYGAARYPIYGIGNTESIVAAMDNDEVEGIVFQNEFNMGYLSVEDVLKKLNKEKRKSQTTIEYYYVEKEMMYGTKMEQLLFPIVK